MKTPNIQQDIQKSMKTRIEHWRHTLNQIYRQFLRPYRPAVDYSLLPESLFSRRALSAGHSRPEGVARVPGAETGPLYQSGQHARQCAAGQPAQDCRFRVSPIRMASA
jgi:hypothetical protein